MSKNSVLVLINVVLMIALILFMLYQKSERDRLDIIKERLAFSLVQTQLIVLEKDIQEQSNNNWNNHEVIQGKIEDVARGIATTISVSRLAKGLSNEDEELLLDIFEYLSEYVNTTYNENVIYTKEELIDIEKFGKSLKVAGWDGDEGNTISENWNETIIKFEKLHDEIFQ